MTSNAKIGHDTFQSEESDRSPRMDNLDLNLLVALDALLDTGSVTEAAARLQTSPPAMSRALGRLRRTLGDPLLVRAGRNLVPTPRALELRAQVAAVLQQARTVLTPRSDTEPAAFERVFAIQAGDAVLNTLAGPLTATVRAHAPDVTLRFLPDALEGTPALRDGRIDLEIGVIDHAEPETIIEPLAQLEVRGVATATHPFITGTVTAEAFAAADHIGISRRGRLTGPIDDRLADLGLTRRVVATVPGFTAALLTIRDTDMITLAPALPDAPALIALGLRSFTIPLDLPPAELAMAWHPRHTADTAHRWLRSRVHETIRAVLLPDKDFHPQPTDSRQ